VAQPVDLSQDASVPTVSSASARRCAVHQRNAVRAQCAQHPAVRAALLLCSILTLLGCESYVPVAEQHGLFSTCCGGSGTCVPSTSVSSEQTTRVAQDSCAEDLLCVPTGLAESEDYVPPTCRAYGQSEGRCLAGCLPEVAKRAERLEQNGCGMGELCVPCFDPVTGEASEACNIGADPGPSEPASLFARCCGDRGTCIPDGIIETGQRERLSADSCDPATHSLCVPQVWVEDPDAKPTTCRAYGDIEGRCLSDCLGEVQVRSEQLSTDVCRVGHKCVPCFDPVSGEPSTACNFGDDAPREPAHVFDACCGDAGACVPKAAIPVADRGRLGQDSCASTDTMCVPRSWVELDRKPPATCRAYGDAEGRCLERCLPEVTQQSDKLRQDSCQDNQLCVPCFDPLTGKDTGACSIGEDAGPREPPRIFASCCQDHGRCVPKDAVPESSQDQLDSRGCEDDASTALCVPSAWLTDPPKPPTSCRAHGDAEGRCLPECLPGLEYKASRLRQDVCEAGDRCVPCFDPLTGENTEACGINGDAPREPAKRFSNCCGEIGACVPSDALEPDDRARLSGTECGGTTPGLCAPKAWIEDERSAPVACRTFGDVEGRCLPDCLPDVASRKSQLQQETCEASYLCVPCFDPVTQESTRACNIGADLPVELPKPFADCCGSVGRCVPSYAVPTSEHSQLAADSCDQSRQPQLCVPEDWAKSDRFTPVACTAPGALEGRCLPACLPDVAKRADQLTVESCAPEHLCVPCFDPLTGEDTHACSINGDKPKGVAKLFPACCGGSGVCVPDQLVAESDRAELGRDSCDPASQAVCAPRSWVGETPQVPRSCTAYEGAEGRCLPSCLPDVAAQQGKLTQDVCGANEQCVPCFDPLDGKDTGACHLVGDPGPKQPAKQFAECCHDVGRCVPTPLISTQERGELAADSCSAEHLCAPDGWLSTPRKVPSTCRGQLSAEGRCLPDCLPEVAQDKARLLQSTCAVSDRCVPCFDPISGESTGACAQAGDPGPTEDPKLFDECCHGGGRCIPGSLVDAKDKSRLDKDNCEEPLDALCVPNPWLADERKPPVSCRAPGDIEGRCLMSCLPEVTKRKDSLAQTTCDEAELCVPCFDPISGESTGACATAGDAPKEPTKKYTSCCGGTGTCVPGALLDGTGDMNHETCADLTAFCVPAAAARGEDPMFTGCDVFLGNGACVPQCFINPSRRGLLDRDRCQSNQLCVRCGSLSSDTAVCD